MNHVTSHKTTPVHRQIRKAVSLCLLSLCLLPAGASAAEQYTTDGVHVRTGPNASSAICLTAEMGTAVTVTGQEGNWVQVSVHGQNGYIYKDYLSDTLLSPEEAAAKSVPASGGSSDDADDITSVDDTAFAADQINSTEVNLRAKANGHCGILAVLEQGETVRILGQDGNWTHIARSDGSEGYAYTIYLGDNKPTAQTDTASADSGEAPSREDAIDAFRTDAISYAEGRLGDTYSQSLRDTEGYADCSSLVRDAYESAVGVFIGNDTSSQADVMNDYFYSIGSITDAAPGDLLYHLSGDRHTGIYLGGGQVLHASQNAGTVKISSYDSSSSYWEYGCNAAAYCYDSLY